MRRNLLGTDLIIDQEKGHKFNLDTVLLARFLNFNPKVKHVIDVGTSQGALALYAALMTQAKITAIDIQEDLTKQAIDNVKLNGLVSQIEVVHQDYLQTNYKDVDVIISNPPFFKVHPKTKINEDDKVAVARHEISLKLEDLLDKVSEQLKNGGQFFMIHKPERVAEIMSQAHQKNLTVKRMQFVHPYANQKANHVLMLFVKQGKPGCIIEKPIIVYKKKGILSDEMIDMMGEE